MMITSGNRVHVLDIGLGNIGSICHAIEEAGGAVEIISNPLQLHKARKLVLPGVGSFSLGMLNLEKLGLVQPLLEFIGERSGFVLAICLGMQLLAVSGTEGGYSCGTGVLSGRVEGLPVRSHNLKLPHMGWNDVYVSRRSPLLIGIPDVFDAYFAHSYAIENCEESAIVAHTTYGTDFPSIVNVNNVYGTQFHPEKSGKLGVQLIRNFISL
jgi:glutamine amidotransferase